MNTANSRAFKIELLEDCFRACERLREFKIPFDFHILNKQVVIRTSDCSLFRQIMNRPIRIHYQMGKSILKGISLDMEYELTEALEYFEARADADHDGDGYIPNEEMNYMSSIQNVLGDPSSHY